MKNITILIHTRNEELNIQECIDSARYLTDNIQIIDMESEDKTVQIASKNNVKISNFPATKYVEPARKFAIDQAETDWVFILDADERMTKDLANEITNTISNFKLQNSNSQSSDSEIRQLITHFKVARKNIFGKKKWLKHGGWWPDMQIRLIYKPAFIDWPKQIHSTPKFKGIGGELENPIIHHFHGDLESMVKKTMLFEDIESDLLFNAHKKTGTLIFFRKFLGELFRRLIKERGFLDGTIGIIESIYQAYSKTITYIFLYEKQQKNKSQKNSSI